jgi:hypothetical protein
MLIDRVKQPAVDFVAALLYNQITHIFLVPRATLVGGGYVQGLKHNCIIRRRRLKCILKKLRLPAWLLHFHKYLDETYLAARLFT